MTPSLRVRADLEPRRGAEPSSGVRAFAHRLSSPRWHGVLARRCAPSTHGKTHRRSQSLGGDSGRRLEEAGSWSSPQALDFQRPELESLHGRSKFSDTRANLVGRCVGQSRRRLRRLPAQVRQHGAHRGVDERRSHHDGHRSYGLHSCPVSVMRRAIARFSAPIATGSDTPRPSLVPVPPSSTSRRTICPSSVSRSTAWYSSRPVHSSPTYRPGTRGGGGFCVDDGCSGFAMPATLHPRTK